MSDPRIVWRSLTSPRIPANMMRITIMDDAKIDAWWFAASDQLPHGDSRPIVIGESHSLCGDIIICGHALHASRHPFDALQYAPGPYLYKVRCWGDVIEQIDKLGARNREYIAMRNATDMLWKFARERALSLIHLWDAPEIVRRYLETGDETIKDAAWAAAWDAGGAARGAARDAAEAAARAAARAAGADAWYAAGAAAEAAAWGAARDAGGAGVAAWAAVRNRFSDLVQELFAETSDV